MNLEFVAFQNTLEHHQARVALTNTMYQNHVYTAEQGLAEMAGSEATSGSCIELVFVDGRCVATFEAVLYETPLAERAFFLDLIVHPDYIRKGIGSLAIKRLENFCGSGMLEVQIREDWAAHQAFYTKHFFRGEPPTLWLAFNPQEFDASMFSDLEARVLAHGIQIETWTDYIKTTESRTELLALRNSFASEFNPSFPPKVLNQAYFDNEVLGAYAFKPEYGWVAVQNNQLVGILLCTGYDGDPTFFFEFGGVTTSVRRSGIASLLVLNAIKAARVGDFQTIEVHLDPKNLGTLPMLERFGFTRQPGYVYFRKFIEKP
jgi:GNAT superfamily N-acetyltransferase